MSLLSASSISLDSTFKAKFNKDFCAIKFFHSNDHPLQLTILSRKKSSVGKKYFLNFPSTNDRLYTWYNGSTLHDRLCCFCHTRQICPNSPKYKEKNYWPLKNSTTLENCVFLFAANILVYQLCNIC